MRHASKWKGWFWLVAVIAGLGQSLAVADNVMPRIADPAEHQALMKLASVVRRTDYNKTVELLGQHPGWQYAPQLQVRLAIALFEAKDHRACKAVCEQVQSTYGQADPVASAWARFYNFRCLVHERKYPEAVERSLQVLAMRDGPADLTPVLQAQRSLGFLLARDKITLDAVISAAAGRADSSALVLMARCTDKAERGDLAGANSYVEELARALPAGDRRVAIAGASLIMSACYAYDRDPKVNVSLLPYCDEVLAGIEQACPQERWLIARAKLTLASAIMRSKTDYGKAERYFREVIDEGTVTDLLPEAYSLLANTLCHQHEYAEASQQAQVVVERYPYSTWTDFAAYLRADSMLRSGEVDQAMPLLNAVVSDYPDSGWSRVAGMMKERASR